MHTMLESICFLLICISLNSLCSNRDDGPGGYQISLPIYSTLFGEMITILGHIVRE